MNISELIVKLIKKKLADKLTFEEIEILNEWQYADERHFNLIQKIENGSIDFDDLVIWLELETDKAEFQNRLEATSIAKVNQSNSKNQTIRKLPKRKERKYLLFAASVVLLISLSSLFFINQTVDPYFQQIVDLQPGKFYGTIKLADGKVISMTEVNPSLKLSDQLEKEDGTLLTDLKDSKKLISMQTGKGNYFHVILSDGTKLWLNADSKVSLPAKFEGSQRLVTLEGEAYFEVAPKIVNGQKIPFIVRTKGQEINVLGTKFNVSAYAEELRTQTTLVEGGVSVTSTNDHIILQAGEQSVLSRNTLIKKRVDVSAYNAWVNNEFSFNEMEITTALAILGRWYDFEVEFIGKVPEVYFYGIISRNKTLNEVLDILKSSSLNFKLQEVDKKIKLTVLNN